MSIFKLKYIRSIDISLSLTIRFCHSHKGCEFGLDTRYINEVKGENSMGDIHFDDGSVWSVWDDWVVCGKSVISTKFEGYWMHVLVSSLDEPNPRANHIHYKYRIDAETGRTHSYVLCAITINGMREFSRRQLIDEVNSLTGLNLTYR